MSEKGLLERLEEYGQRGRYPFHMPGHKRAGLPFPNPYSIDITEIDGFDNLHHPEGILREAMERAARIYGSDQTWFLVNGSTCGILSAICGTTDRGGTLVMSRNCHKSAYHGVFLNELKSRYLYPQTIRRFGILGGILPENVEKSLQMCPEVQAVLVVSPTYEGVVSDIEGIAEVVHRRGLPLIVDEAHGAHLPFAYQGHYPKPALDLGADVVIQSLHKTLPSFTQTAVLHMREGYVDRERVERYLSIYQTSSPSYLFLAAMDQCIRLMEEDGGDRLESLYKRTMALRKWAETLDRIRIPGPELTGQDGVFGYDPSKLVISLAGTGMSGEWLAERFRREYGLEPEMAATDYVLLMTSPFDREEGFSRLEQALAETDQYLKKRNGDQHFSRAAQTLAETDQYWREQEIGWDLESLEGKLSAGQKLERAKESAMTIYKAWNGKTRPVSWKESQGAVSGEFVYLYPPGIPVLAPGERITRQALELIQDYREKGLPVQGMKDQRAEQIEIWIGES